jgi:hypothetical protein
MTTDIAIRESMPTEASNSSNVKIKLIMGVKRPPGKTCSHRALTQRKTVQSPCLPVFPRGAAIVARFNAQIASVRKEAAI